MPLDNLNHLAYREREYHTVILSALLHDIGKYLQRGLFGALKVKGQHPQVGADFVSAWHDLFDRCVDASQMHTLVQRHHESHHFPDALRVDTLSDNHTRALARLISRADNMASSERAPRDTDVSSQPFRTTALAPIFDRIVLLKKHEPSPRHFEHKPLSNADEQPPLFSGDGREVNQDDVTRHIRAFGDRFAQMKDRLDWDKFDCVYTHLLSLLQTYTWCIPSDTQATPPDVSLYDHLRTTSAIAACVYQYHCEKDTLSDKEVSAQDQTRCVLLIGDLSGIQDYIFGISNVGPGGVAKRLRARSFYVQLLSDAASLIILRYFNVPIANILMASGGKFYILLPNVTDIQQHMDHLQQEFDTHLLKEMHGALTINLAWIPMPDNDFAAGRYGHVLKRLYERLQHRKMQRMRMVLQNEETWSSEFARDSFTGTSVCAACRRFPATHHSQDRNPDEAPDICKQCDEQVSLGRQLTTARYVSFLNQGAGTGDLTCMELAISIDERRPRSDAFLTMSLNNPDLSAVGHVPAMFRYMANYIPRDTDNSPVTFDEIAGKNGYLGVLKADVDYLGQIFQEGLRRDTPDVSLDTVSRLAALSRQIEWFFSGWLEWLMRTEFNDCYTVYSGGDDLLIVGPRKRILLLSQRIQNAFSQYTNQPEITISAGIAIVKPRLPIAHTVQDAEDALSQAKNKGRDGLCILGEIVAWDDLDQLLHEMDQLTASDATSSFLYHLLHCAGLWHQYRYKRELTGLSYHPMLSYQIGRNISREKQPQLYAWANRLRQFPPSEQTERLFNHLKIIVQSVLFDRREKSWQDPEIR